MGKKFDVITIDGVDYKLGGGSNVDIHIEDDTLVINTDGTGGTGGSSGGSGSVSKVFEDVEELPEAPNSNLIYRVKEKSTPVPNDGREIGTIYFNTHLSLNEIKSTIDNANLTVVDGTLFQKPDYNFYPVLLFDASDTSNAINQFLEYDSNTLLIFAIGKTGTEADGNYYILLQGMTTNSQIPVFLSHSGGGWYLKEYTINSMASPTFQGIPVGINNDKIANIVNINNKFNTSAEYYNHDGTQYNTLCAVSFSPVFIKKTTFTSRSSLYEWMSFNYGTIVKLKYYKQKVDLGTWFNIIHKYNDTYTCVDGISNASNGSGSGPSTEHKVDEIYCDELTISNTTMYHINRYGNAWSHGEVPDDRWVDNGGEVSVTVYYID
jgi:hypothetical protein